MKPAFKKIILFIVIVVVITIVAVLVLGKNDTETTKILQTTGLSTTTESEDDDSGEFLQSLSQIKAINLDTTFFKNKSYQKLVDFSITPVIEDPRIIGRPNPFAPIGADSASNTPNTQNDVVDPSIKNPN